MSPDSQDHFAGERLLQLRREIEEHGFVTDEFLPDDPDCPVFGINLACAHPFPAMVESSYAGMAARLEQLDEGVYVYPLWETHVTIMTFLNFSRHRRPAPEKVAEMRSCIGPIAGLLKTVIDSERINAFRLEFRPPVLTRKAAILPVANPTGEITRLRQRAGRLLEEDGGLRETLARGGLTVPGIIHSTILRFKRPPADGPRFAAGFDAIAATTAPLSIPVRELLLTAETRPYMRGGEIIHRFELP